MNPVLKKWAQKYFSDGELNQVEQILSQYGTEAWHLEPDRVLRDALIVSRGSIEKLRETIKLAMNDYRDVLVGEEVDPWLIEELKKSGVIK